MESMGNESRLDELNNFIHELWEFSDAVRRHAESEKLTEKQKKRAAELYIILSKKVGYLGTLISELSGISKVNLQGKDYDMWLIALKMPADKHANSALGVCIQATNRAIGKLRDDINKGIRDEQGNLINIKKPSSISTESPLEIFDAMHLHPKVVEASKSLFETGHYAQAIFEAFKAVENFVKDKSGLSLYGKNLMTRAFDEENPLIQVPEAGHFDKDVQEGFKFLFMGATLGIRNPKAHKEIIQKDPYITLEYLGFASFLLKRIDYWEADIS